MKFRDRLLSYVQAFSVSMIVFGLILGVLAQMAVIRVAHRLIAANQTFTQEAQRSPLSLFPEIWAGYQSAQQEPVQLSRWLILGKDQVEGSGRSAILTDSMIVATFQPSEGKVRLLSLPRDWYHPQLATKINALYAYGSQRDEKNPTTLVQSALSEMLGVNFDHVIELSLADVQEVIDAIGGIEVEVSHGFVDERFPRSGVDVRTVTDPNILYETIQFATGSQRMTGETALKFMRSRHSSDPEEGNDEARVRRQQKVIESLVEALSSTEVLVNPEKLARLYLWYADHFQSEVSLFELGRMMGAIAQSRKAPKIEKIDLPLTVQSTATDEAALLVHPPTEKYGQWVFEAEDPSYQEVHNFIQKSGL